MKLMLRVLGMLRHRGARFSSIGPTLNRRWLFMAAVVAIALASLPTGATAFSTDGRTPQWVGTWATAPAGPTPPESFAPAPEFNNQTLRLIVHTSTVVDAIAQSA